jgi:uncharacterized membrane protein
LKIAGMIAKIIAALALLWSAFNLWQLYDYSGLGHMPGETSGMAFIVQTGLDFFALAFAAIAVAIFATLDFTTD